MTKFISKVKVGFLTGNRNVLNICGENMTFSMHTNTQNDNKICNTVSPAYTLGVRFRTGIIIR